MEQTEIASLKAEITRLNKIITVLIEQNDLQREQIAIAKIGEGNHKLRDALVKIIEGNPKLCDALVKIGEGNSKLQDALVKIIEGNTNLDDALVKIGEGNPNLSNAFAKIDVGNPQLQNPVASIYQGNSNVTNPLPLTLPVNPINIASIAAILKHEGFNKVRKTAIRNTALLLLHFYNKGGGSHAELRKLTGLSRFGMGKFTGSLKKRGLIERDGWQKFKLTPHALDLIQKAHCVS